MSFAFGTNSLSSYIFNWIASPFKKNKDEIKQQKQEQEQPKHEHKEQQEPTNSHVQTPQPIQEVEENTQLPTAFMPHFPSLSRPSSATTQSITSSSTRPFKSSQSSNFRRTLYIGPGHSSMNPSTRLGMARRKRLGISKPPPSSNYIDESSNGINNQPRDISEAQTPKRVKTNHHHNNNNIPSSANHFQSTEAPPSNQTFSLPPPSNPSLRAVKNLNVTPMRPSPLRNVTLPSVASSPPAPQAATPEPQTTPSSMTKRRNHKKTASIISSVMKEVNQEMSNRTPAASPIKPSQVINPYSSSSNLRVTPIIKKSNPSLKKNSLGSSNITLPLENKYTQDQIRKRKVQVCLDDTRVNHSSLHEVPSSHSTTSNQNSIEQILQKTMPKEFYPEETTSNNGGVDELNNNNINKKKKKTGQVGKLPERLILKKKQQQEQQQREKRLSFGKTIQDNDNSSITNKNKEEEERGGVIHDKKNNYHLNSMTCLASFSSTNKNKQEEGVVHPMTSLPSFSSSSSSSINKSSATLPLPPTSSELTLPTNSSSSSSSINKNYVSGNKSSSSTLGNNKSHSSFELKPNQFISNSKPPPSTSTTTTSFTTNTNTNTNNNKTFHNNKVPTSSSLFGNTNTNYMNSSRSSLLLQNSNHHQQQNQSPTSSSSFVQQSSFNPTTSTTTVNFFNNKMHVVDPFLSDIVEKEKKKAEKDNDQEEGQVVVVVKKKEENQKLGGEEKLIKEKLSKETLSKETLFKGEEEEEESVKSLVESLGQDEIRKHFNHNLLQDHLPPPPSFPNPHDDILGHNNQKEDLVGVKETVLGFPMSELVPFLF